MTPQALTPTQLAARLEAGDDLVLLDVREPHETDLGVLPGSRLIPMGELSVRHTELDPDRETVVICHHGVRSAHVAVALERLGFDHLFNLTGGVDRWAREVDPGFPRY